MIVKNATTIDDSDIERFSWSGLRKFHHVPTVEKLLIDIHGIDKSQIANIRKQARQIRQCLLQAKEYKDAARVTSLATRPLLLYYSLMSLAITQILLKGDGMSSLDRARGQHAHHGLSFKNKSIPKGTFELELTAGSLVAKPMIKTFEHQGAIISERQGTFELWHRTARDLPLTGHFLNRLENWESPTRVYFTAPDARLSTLSESGISLMDCFAALPGMHHWLHDNGAYYHTVRAELSGEIQTDGNERFHLLVHPHKYPQIVNALAEHILVPADLVNITRVYEHRIGFSFEMISTDTRTIFVDLPPAVVWAPNDLRFVPPNRCLTEFGYIYAALFILGNLARYYPDQWVEEVDQGTPLAMAADQFINMAEWRMAQLTLSELSRTNLIAKH